MERVGYYLHSNFCKYLCCDHHCCCCNIPVQDLLKNKCNPRKDFSESLITTTGHAVSSHLASLSYTRWMVIYQSIIRIFTK